MLIETYTLDEINKRSVIIVDDCEQLRKKIIETVNGLNRFNVIGEADNGIDAIALIESERPNFLILDIRMPGKSGIQVLDAIQHLVSDICVIVLTNHSGDAYKERCLKLGVDYFLDKSKEFEQLNSILC